MLTSLSCFSLFIPLLGREIYVHVESLTDMATVSFPRPEKVSGKPLALAPNFLRAVD